MQSIRFARRFSGLLLFALFSAHLPQRLSKRLPVITARSNDTLAELCSGHNSVSLKITRLFGNSEIFCASSDSVWYALTYAIKCFLSTQVGLMHASLAVIPFRVWPREPDVLKSEEKPRCFYSSWIDARIPSGYTFSRLALRA